MFKNHYPTLFKDDPVWLERASTVGQQTYELTQYLVDVLGVEDVGASFHGSVTYHDSCHLYRGLGVGQQPRKLIAKVDGCRLIEMKDSTRCCGFGGTFAMNYPEISTSILEDKVKNIIASGADAVVGCDISCLMNMQGLLNRQNQDIKVLHIAQLLAGVQ